MRLTGATYRQLTYWTDVGYVTTLGDPAVGSGHSRRYSLQSVQNVRMIVTLVHAGVNLAVMGAAIREGKLDEFLTGLGDALLTEWSRRPEDLVPA